MSTYDELVESNIAEPNQLEEALQKWELPFRDLLDEIYWQGYSKKLIENDPEEYQREYWYFIKMYD